ncbi:MAG: hypothetical protein PF694_14985 [Bacteroidetes bacterium]|jgi:cytochrome c5|nr:hypothetical protein [Bacteroidota bacterium]
MEHQTTKFRKWLLFAGLILSLGLSACYKDNEEDLYPDNGESCNTENVSFSQTIEPLVNNNCLSCHSTTNTSGGVRLDSHSAIAEAATNGRLLGAIRHEAGFSAMPQGGKLPDCAISQFEAWASQGALNN